MLPYERFGPGCGQVHLSVAAPPDCPAERATLAALDTAFGQWRRQFPRETVVFQVTELDPMLYSRPKFMPRDNNRSVAIVAAGLQRTFERRCG